MAEARLTISLAGLRDDHPAAQAALGELVGDLRSEPQLRTKESSAAFGVGKGAPPELIVSLSAATVAGLARIVSLWLNRDKRRSIKVSLRTPTSERNISVEGDQISVKALTAALDAALKLEQPTAESRTGAVESGSPTPELAIGAVPTEDQERPSLPGG